MDDDFSAADDLESRTDEQSSGGDTGSLGAVKQEMKSLNIVRTFVFALMITMATITGEVLFVGVRIHEEGSFKNGFKEHADVLIESFFEQLESKIVATESLATALTLQSHDMGSQWPYVSFAEFERRSAAAMRGASASAVTFAPKVTAKYRKGWEIYAVLAKDEGILSSNYTYDFEPETGHLHAQGEDSVFYHSSNRSVQDGIYRIRNSSVVELEPETLTSFPVWQRTPLELERQNVRMFDQMSNRVRAQALSALLEGKGCAMTDFLVHDTDMTDFAYYATPRSALYYPIYGSLDQSSVVAALDFEFQWETFLEAIMDDHVDTLVVVAESSCGNTQTFEVTGPKVNYVGQGDRRPENTDSFAVPPPVESLYQQFRHTLVAHGHVDNHTMMNNASLPCDFRLRVFATEDLFQSYMTKMPNVYRFSVMGMFIVTIAVFLIYDCIVERRASGIVESAKQTDALVSTLFPSSVKRRLLEQAKAKKKREEKNRVIGWQVKSREFDPKDFANSDSSEMRLPMIHTPKKRLKSFLHPGSGADDIIESEESEPIADLFPNASVMFADISGFTAWSSERDPSQVFTLLETLYRAMDKAARRFGVFKVETIGDCYVAACGLPETREDHVETLVRFARSCLYRSNELTNALEGSLGPGTAELALRFGIHCGPITAGVLRGEKARFQLFGDTMNYAARMESTGVKNKIQLSKPAGDALIARGKGHWVELRDETVFAKGKGEVQTYWLMTGTSSSSVSLSASTDCDSSCASGEMDEAYHRSSGDARSGALNSADLVLRDVVGKTKPNKATNRLVEWNTGALLALLKKVVVGRKFQEQHPAKSSVVKEGTSRSFLDEIEMVIPLPQYDEEAVSKIRMESVELPRSVERELRAYIAAIASGYRKNAFHNFEHASHVILSATKLLKRMSYADGHKKEEGLTTEDLHHHTYGISSDPLTQFAVVFSALIHDVGHEGIPNGQLAAELPEIAARYEHKSIAEQRSVDVALELLMLPKYQNLRRCICGSEEDLSRFRKLLVNCVLATDIFDPDLKKARNERWEQAFRSERTDDTTEDLNRKATIVIEHIIQASDVSHTMQHWHIYIKWNERLFQELYTAYRAGRATKDPSESWYKGELWFFDNYVIPLAKKLEECGVFGVSSDEYLTYAMQNRVEWEERGEEICRQMIERCKKKLDEPKKQRSMLNLGNAVDKRDQPAKNKYFDMVPEDDNEDVSFDEEQDHVDLSSDERVEGTIEK